jgi:hypothetical protein
MLIVMPVVSHCGALGSTVHAAANVLKGWLALPDDAEPVKAGSTHSVLAAAAAALNQQWTTIYEWSVTVVRHNGYQWRRLSHTMGTNGCACV